MAVFQWEDACFVYIKEARTVIKYPSIGRKQVLFVDERSSYYTNFKKMRLTIELMQCI